MPPFAPKSGAKPRVVIVGAGFAGLSAARGLSRAPVEVTVVDRQNHHLFQPLLYQVATAALSPADIASPIRTILRDQPNATVILAEVTGIDTRAREVVTRDGRIPYDHLIVATGARHSYFGRDDWADYAAGLKRIEDATELRRRILLAFEQAEAAADPVRRRALLTFVVIGGGPTGVEMAGAIAELARTGLAREFRRIDPRSARVVLVEAADRLLASFDPGLSAAAAAALAGLGVEVRVNHPVTACDAMGVSLGGYRIDAETVVWAAGVMASAAGRWLGAATDKAGRVLVRPDLSLPGRPEVFVIGDTANVAGPDARPLPGTAPVAKQQGRYVAALVGARLRGRDLPPFRFRDLGMMATIGRRQAIVQFGRVRLKGGVAWLLWSAAHIYFLIGFRNRLLVALNWAWSYATYARGTRLITGAGLVPPQAPEAPRLPPVPSKP
jgi:NADH dehydrogenase